MSDKRNSDEVVDGSLWDSSWQSSLLLRCLPGSLSRRPGRLAPAGHQRDGFASPAGHHRQLSPAATPRVPRQLRARPELEPTRHERPPAWTQALVPTWNGESCAAVRLGKSSSSIRNALSSNNMTFVHEEKTCIATLRCMVLLRVIGIAMSMFMRMFVIIYNACYTTFTAQPTMY